MTHAVTFVDDVVRMVLAVVITFVVDKTSVVNNTFVVDLTGVVAFVVAGFSVVVDLAAVTKGVPSVGPGTSPVISNGKKKTYNLCNRMAMKTLVPCFIATGYPLTTHSGYENFGSLLHSHTHFCFLFHSHKTTTLVSLFHNHRIPTLAMQTLVPVL